tara:strand:- start:1987 stop:2421 length:435 start_codon:yes stop_codon:yes gene_type:complete
MESLEKPYILFVAEIIYKEIYKIKKQNPEMDNTQAVESFIGCEIYNEISSGEFHENWFKELKKNNFIDKITKTKIPDETVRLLEIQKEMMKKQLIRFPDLYYTKNQSPLKISQRAFELIWRMCESYELWCKETNQKNLLKLNIT